MSKSLDSKLVILGNPAVGKSALTVRFLTKRFISEYDPTLEWTYKFQGTVDDEAIIIEILDTAGQGDVEQQEGYIRWGEGFMLVYSVTDRESFLHISEIHQLISNTRKSLNFSCIIVGNKNDLNHFRQVERAEGEQLATDLGCGFFECSASEGDDDVYETFWELHREVVRRRLMSTRRRRSSAQQMIQAFNKMFTKMNN